MSAGIEPALEALEQALKAEREALLAHDVDALLASTDAKLTALRRAESLAADAGSAERLGQLRDFNQANGVLLARRRREVNWALRHPGARPQARCLGVG